MSGQSSSCFAKRFLLGRPIAVKLKPSFSGGLTKDGSRVLSLRLLERSLQLS